MTPPRTMALILLASICLVGSFMWFGVEHKDISQLVIYVAVSLGIYYVAYDQWHKVNKTTGNEKDIKDMRENLQEQIDELNTAMNKMDDYFQEKLREKK